MSEEQMKSDGGDKTQLRSLQSALERMIGVASAQNVFGPPAQQGDTMVIPCAEVFAGMGMGFGSGSGTESGESQESGTGEGGGGGGSAHGRPVAAIIITPHGVRVEPIIDITKVALAGVTAGAFTLSWLLRMQRTMSKAEKKGLSFEEAKRAIQG